MRVVGRSPFRCRSCRVRFYLREHAAHTRKLERRERLRKKSGSEGDGWAGMRLDRKLTLIAIFVVAFVVFLVFLLHLTAQGASFN
jgi:hypothetical protein